MAEDFFAPRPIGRDWPNFRAGPHPEVQSELQCRPGPEPRVTAVRKVLLKRVHLEKVRYTRHTLKGTAFSMPRDACVAHGESLNP